MCDCGGRSEVVETRPAPKGHLRRRRKCATCGTTWATREIRVADHFRQGRAVVTITLEIARTATPTEVLFRIAEALAEEGVP